MAYWFVCQSQDQAVCIEALVHCVVFLGKTLSHPGVYTGSGELNVWGSREQSRSTLTELSLKGCNP